MKTNVRKEILGIPAPKRALDSKYHDKNCPFTGTLAVKKEMLKGKVIKKDISKSATIEWYRPFFVPKYERYEVRRSRLRVHNPPCLDAQVGQKVLVARTRPLSKTKNHVIIQILEKDEEIIERKAADPARKKKELKNIEEEKKAEKVAEEKVEEVAEEVSEESKKEIEEDEKVAQVEESAGEEEVEEKKEEESKD